MWSPEDYAEAAVIAREAGEEMLARLEWMTIKPNVILDIGCGTGELSAQLQTRYPDAHVLALDHSERMIHYARRYTLFSICGDGETLPLRNQSVEMIFVNFLLPWHADVKNLLREWRRVLRPNGLLMFTALGPDTLREVRDYFSAEWLPQLVDMHDFGDVLLQVGFADPVLDVSHFTTTYRDQARLIHELRASGMLAGTAVDFPGPVNIAPSANGTWEVTYEVVYAHAFAPAESDTYSVSSDGTVRVPLSQLRHRLSTKSSES